MKRLIVYMAGILLLAGCSTTKHLPEGEILYTGQKKMIVENRSTTPVGETAMERKIIVWNFMYRILVKVLIRAITRASSTVTSVYPVRKCREADWDYLYPKIL